VDPAGQPGCTRRVGEPGVDTLTALLAVNPAAAAPVARRSLHDYEQAAGVDTHWSGADR
jgi:hypothetical protein